MSTKSLRDFVIVLFVLVLFAMVLVIGALVWVNSYPASVQSQPNIQPTRTPLLPPTWTPVPPTSTPDARCHSANDWAEFINIEGNYDVWFGTGRQGWDHEWSMSDPPFGTYGVMYSGPESCVRMAATIAVVNADFGVGDELTEFYTADLMSAMLSYFATGDDGASQWYIDKMRECEIQDVRDYFVDDKGQDWMMTCKVDGSLISLTLTVEP